MNKETILIKEYFPKKLLISYQEILTVGWLVYNLLIVFKRIMGNVCKHKMKMKVKRVWLKII